jgi:hypothetical protein
MSGVPERWRNRAHARTVLTRGLAWLVRRVLAPGAVDLAWAGGAVRAVCLPAGLPGRRPGA